MDSNVLKTVCIALAVAIVKQASVVLVPLVKDSGRAGDLHAGVRRFESHQRRPS